MATQRAQVAAGQPLGDAFPVEPVPAGARHHAELVSHLVVLDANDAAGATPGVTTY
jgi:hypothetical protein